MSNKKMTKRALMTSVLAIVMCLVMLIGSTFAWFTDTASTGVNKITAGNLHVQIQDKDGAKIENLEWVTEEGTAIENQNDILWEPGCTYLLTPFKIVNTGNLALKYKIVISGLDGNSELLDVIKFTYKVGGVESELNEEGHLKVGEATDMITVSAHMDEAAGNTYMNKELNNVRFTVYATQDTVEADSFTKDYDALAEYPLAASGNVTLTENTDTVAEKATIVSAEKTEDGDHVAKAVIPVGAKAETVEITQMTLSVTNAAKPANLTITSNQSSHTLEVKMIGLSADNTELIKVELFVRKNLSDFKLYYHEQEMAAKTSVDAVTANQDYYYDKTTGIVTFLTDKFSPFTCVYNKGNWSDNTEGEYETPIDENSKTVTIATAEELALFASEVNGGKSYAGYTVKLVDDIDLGAKIWTPIGKSGKTFQGIFDGQGHTISNLVCGTSSQSDVGLFGVTTNGEIKNFTLNNAKVKGYLDVGAVAGTPYTSKYTNIKLTGNVQIDGYAYVGGMFGKNAYANLTDLTIAVDAGSYVKAESDNYRTYVGGLVGFMGEGNQVVSNVTSNINVIGSTCDVGGITGIAHYGNTFINCKSSGNVTLTSAQDEGDHLEIGGIAGVWLNAAGQTVTFTSCSFTGNLSTTLNGVDKSAELGSSYEIVGAKYDRTSEAGTLIIN